VIARIATVPRRLALNCSHSDHSRSPPVAILMRASRVAD